jgi:hypothetical protein
MHIRCRPVSSFPAEFHRSPTFHNPFRAGSNDTLWKLEYELDKLGAVEVVIELALTESEIRIDGWPRAGARPSHPGVVVSFDSRHGPLRYGTDAFPDWQANVRGIALGLEALRKIDRYGISHRGEQYTGWKQLSAGDSGFFQRGRELIAEHGGETAALKATHKGGDADDFRAVQAVRES